MKRTIGKTAVLGMIVCMSSMSLAQTRLNYKQEQDLKDTTYYLDEVENITNQIADALSKWKPGDSSVQINQVKARIDWKDQAIKKLGYAEERLKRLPEHDKVKPERERFLKQRELLVEQEKKLNEINEKLSGVVSQGDSAGYKADFDRLKEINMMFANEQIINTQPEKAIDIIKQISAVKAERARIAEKYADLLKQPTGASQDMQGVLRHFDDVFGRFDKFAQDFRSKAPADIDERCAKIVKMGDTAIKDDHPGYFGPTGGIASELEFTRIHVALLSAFDPDATVAKTAAAKLEATRKQVSDMADKMMASILQNNRVPDDQYNGSDKADLVKLVNEKWTKEGTGAQVLKSGINSQDWQRNTYWEWMSSAWYKTDRSKIQGYVVYKLDDQTAGIMYIWLVKDHLKNDRIDASFFDDVKAPVSVSRKILMKNVQ